MKIRWRHSSLATVTLVVITLAAWQLYSRRPAHRAPPEPGWAALTESLAETHAAMTSLRPSGHADIDFVALMLPHHQAAVDMAKAELLFGSDPQMRRLAQEVLADQQSEIAPMQLWLKRRGARSETPAATEGTHQ